MLTNKDTEYDADAVRQDHLRKIARVKERIDYAILFSIIVAITLGSFSLVSLWAVLAYLLLVAVYQFRWSNEALIKRLESLDSSYEFNETSFLENRDQSDDDHQEIAYEAAQVLLREFDEQDIVERSGDAFYEQLLCTVDREGDDSRHAA